MDGAAGAARRLGYDVQRDRAADTRRSARRRASVLRVRPGCVGCTLSGSSRQKICVIASGETTVTLGGSTASADATRSSRWLQRWRWPEVGGVALASIGTDGIDGPTDAAGAIADGTTIPRAQAMGLDASVALARHDSHPFFQALGDLVVTGPTGTNVGDLQVFIAGSSLSPRP